MTQPMPPAPDVPNPDVPNPAPATSDFLKALSTVIGQLRRLADAFGIRVEDWAEMTRLYSDGLDDLPPELMPLMVKRLMKRWDNGFRLPLPAELRAMIAPELAAHTTALLHRRREEQKARLATLRVLPCGLRPETRAEEAARLKARAKALGFE